MCIVLSTYALDIIYSNVYKINVNLEGIFAYIWHLKSSKRLLHDLPSCAFRSLKNKDLYLINYNIFKKNYSFLLQHLSIHSWIKSCIVFPFDAASDFILFLFSFVISNLKYALSLSIISLFYYLFILYILFNIFKYYVLNKIYKTKVLYITFNI